jgi:hypothetical protein
MIHLVPYTLFESKITTDQFDKVLDDLTGLIGGGDTLTIRHKRHLISSIYSNKDKTLSDIKVELWEKETLIKSKSEFNKFVGEVLPLVKDFNVTKFKQLLKALTSQTTGRKVNL